MFSSTIAKAAVLLTLLAGPALAWGGGAAPPQPSHSSCTYSCPESDQGQYGVHEPSCGKEGNNMICAYPSQKLGPNDYNRDATCTYDASTGKLMSDNDTGLCPKSASSQCKYGRSYKHEDNLTASLAKAEKRKEAARAGPSVPESMKARHSRRTLNRL